MNLIPRHTLFDNWFDQDFPAFRLLPSHRSDQGMLAVDIHETDKEFTLKADFPGMKKEDVSVTIDNNVLTLSAEYEEEKTKENKGKVVRQERRYGKCSRSFTLGSGVDEQNIQAGFSDGVLTLHIPKVGPPAAKSKSIPIK